MVNCKKVRLYGTMLTFSILVVLLFVCNNHYTNGFTLLIEMDRTKLTHQFKLINYYWFNESYNSNMKVLIELEDHVDDHERLEYQEVFKYK